MIRYYEDSGKYLEMNFNPVSACCLHQSQYETKQFFSSPFKSKLMLCDDPDEGRRNKCTGQQVKKKVTSRYCYSCGG